MSDQDVGRLRPQLLNVCSPIEKEKCADQIVLGDTLKVLPCLPTGMIDLMIVDPPYNLTKNFDGAVFSKKSASEYESWLQSWLSLARPLLKKTASIYICSEWRTSGIVSRVAEEFFVVRNRVTWEREKGRGAQRNWKNCAEDIWFCTASDEYFFDVDAVKIKRRVVAPYRDTAGRPKDWETETDGDFRITHPSNLWTDITVPFWSMPENTDHPTQKPEKLVAKLILASSKVGDLVFDPFAGSGTIAVVAKKLGRHYLGIEISEVYCMLAQRRLELADRDKTIQGYRDGVFWERNTLNQQNKNGRVKASTDADSKTPSLFEGEE